MNIDDTTVGANGGSKTLALCLKACGNFSDLSLYLYDMQIIKVTSVRITLDPIRSQVN